MRTITGLVAVCVLTAALGATPAAAELSGKVQLYGHRLDPEGQDARRFTRSSWGGGLSALVAVPGVHRMLTAEAGIEYTNFLSETTEFRDDLTGLRVEQQTDQYYVRFYAGPRVGLHGNGFIRPYFATHIAAVLYGISTDVVIPDDTNRQNEIRQNLRDENKAAFGYDISVGVDWNLLNRFPIETGMRFLKSVNVPQQLGDGSIAIQPGYVQYYAGIGFNFPVEDRW